MLISLIYTSQIEYPKSYPKKLLNLHFVINFIPEEVPGKFFKFYIYKKSITDNKVIIDCLNLKYIVEKKMV